MSDHKNEITADVLKGEEHLLLDHNYDGIQELDYVLPRWWLGIFYLTIVFSAFYVGYYMAGSGMNQSQELAVDLKAIDSLRPPAPSTGGEGTNQAQLLAAFQDQSKVKQGQLVYTAKCLACHGDKGQGVVGPNLTDDHWLNGKGTLSDVASVVSNGVVEKGMPPWGAILSPDELVNVVAFVHSLHGSNPPQAKAPQGTAYEFKD